MSYPRHLPHFDQAVRKGAWNERMVAGEYAVRFPDKVTLGSTVAFRAMRSLSVVGPSSDRIVAHPDITRSSNLNFGAVVLKNGVLSNFVGGCPLRPQVTGSVTF